MWAAHAARYSPDWHLVAHAESKLHWDRGSWILTSPSYHRQHHSILSEHHDSNFVDSFRSGIYCAGTYRRPVGFPPTGLDHAPRNLREIMIWPWLQRDAGNEDKLQKPSLSCISEV